MLPIILNSDKLCSFCKLTIGQPKLMLDNYGWYYCNECSDKCDFAYNNYMKKNNYISYEQFLKLTSHIFIPNYFTIKRSNGTIDNNWTLTNILTKDYFLYWFQGDWVILLSKKINNQSHVKYMKLYLLKEYNNINVDQILNILNNYVTC